ncbi:putative RNA helicase [Helianthus annuus]|uniref:Putative P-loop containing nucleoside triphosphate hydrolase n=1 Tax=Helianthus annuus TaxID=4232 RepID=A0A251RTP4_HELAN|nr:putative RNA helicase [Helianthus annuus]KAJ0449214.1 putative RNA helicase [Helianthus annuus]KAJ0637868.1 putative RNA helicase [Helianthus annuus]KAJ0815060.1 putative RNA helicase [Helianthus annuus]KAJ0828372.1 putative RNA helicase [Helianthus annuus]
MARCCNAGDAVLEKLYKARWGLEDGVGSIIMSPTRELADQLFIRCTEICRQASRVQCRPFNWWTRIRRRERSRESYEYINLYTWTPSQAHGHNPKF